MSFAHFPWIKGDAVWPWENIQSIPLLTTVTCTQTLAAALRMDGRGQRQVCPRTMG